jgi:uncharacterized spore protein YtfJ
MNKEVRLKALKELKESIIRLLQQSEKGNPADIDKLLDVLSWVIKEIKELENSHKK